MTEQEQKHSQLNNEMLERVTQTPSAVINHAYIELPEHRKRNEDTTTTE